MAAAIRAGVLYFAIVFMVGFVLGTIRVLVVIPRFGESNALLLELPVMLALSWFACTWLVGRYSVPPMASARLAMGAVAFLLLMVGELGVSVFGFGRSVAEHLEVYRSASAQLGLAAQLVFAAFPLLQLLRRT
ncbi:MAG: hypothetical protein ABL996_08360 [Micropepsaceae bacterium]